MEVVKNILPNKKVLQFTIFSLKTVLNAFR